MLLSKASPTLRLVRRFRRNRRGAAAVEFGLVAVVFFPLLFAIIESALMFFASQVLETGVQDSARLILTGEAQGKAQAAALDKASFKTNMCNRISTLFSCDNLYIDVQSYSSFKTVKFDSPIDGATKTFVDTTQYVPGNAGDIVIVRAFYQWPLYATSMGFDISNLAGGKRLLTASAAFRNEPF